MPMRVKISFVKIFLVFAGIAFAYAGSELILASMGYSKKIDILKERIAYLERLNSGKRTVYIYRYGREALGLGWLYAPGAEDVLETSEFKILYKINSKGLRDEEHDYEKKKGIFRILALGDSLTFGESVNTGKRYTGLIGKALDKTEVVNMGVQGFGIDQALLYFEKEGVKYHPDLVILFITDVSIKRCASFRRESGFKPRFELDPTGEKLVIAKTPVSEELEKPMPVKREEVRELEAEYKRALESSFFEYSILFNFLRYRSKEAEIEKKVREELENRDHAFWGTVKKNISGSKTNDIPDKTFLKIVFLILDSYAQECRKMGARFLVVNIDTQRLIDVEQYCRRRQIAYVDLNDRLREISATKSIRFNIDPHYNEFGHRVIGEYVSSYLSRNYRLTKNKDFVYMSEGGS